MAGLRALLARRVRMKRPAWTDVPLVRRLRECWGVWGRTRESRLVGLLGPEAQPLTPRFNCRCLALPHQDANAIAVVDITLRYMRYPRPCVVCAACLMPRELHGLGARVLRRTRKEVKEVVRLQNGSGAPVYCLATLPAISCTVAFVPTAAGLLSGDGPTTNTR